MCRIYLHLPPQKFYPKCINQKRQIDHAAIHWFCEMWKSATNKKNPPTPRCAETEKIGATSSSPKNHLFLIKMMENFRYSNLRIFGMSWGVKNTFCEAPGVSLGGSGVSIGVVKILTKITPFSLHTSFIHLPSIRQKTLRPSVPPSVLQVKFYFSYTSHYRLHAPHGKLGNFSRGKLPAACCSESRRSGPTGGRVHKVANKQLR